jgi:hypothetical protein
LFPRVEGSASSQISFGVDGSDAGRIPAKMAADNDIPGDGRQGGTDMAQHHFRMRLSCSYAQPDNTVAELSTEIMAEGEWRSFELDFKAPGFLIFVYAILNCQHLYMRTNAAERGLALESADGSIEVGADKDWVIQSMRVDFEARLKAGSPSAEDIDYIVDRMGHCPVSVNLAEIDEAATTLRFV